MRGTVDLRIRSLVLSELFGRLRETPLLGSSAMSLSHWQRCHEFYKFQKQGQSILREIYGIFTLVTLAVSLVLTAEALAV